MKLEFGYKNLARRNFQTFQVFFVILNVIIEQILTRLAMSESLMINPILGALTSNEMISILGSEDF